MSQQLTEKEVVKQSQMALAQNRELWEKNAKINGEVYKNLNKKYTDLNGDGCGKAIIIIAMGQSLEEQIQTIKNHSNRNDIKIACCDKAFGILLDKGVKADYVFLADARMSYDKWLKPYIEETKDVTLLSCVTANTEWIANWKGKKYFYVNKDVIKSEQLFCSLSGCAEVLPASSNVGNTVVVFSEQVLKFDEYYLVGYDFSWRPGENYYAFAEDKAEDKRYWMKNKEGMGINNEYYYTSNNLAFSNKWLLYQCHGVYYPKGIKIWNCSEHGTLNIKTAKLSEKLRGFKGRDKTVDETKMINYSKSETAHFVAANKLDALEREHLIKTITDFVDNKSVYEVNIRYVSPGVNYDNDKK